MSLPDDIPDDVYVRLLALRDALRQFERWSAQQAKAAGLTPAQHQLLLAIRGHGDADGPTIGEVADHLLLQHHSVVGLVDRAEAAGLVARTRGDDDKRVVRLHLTPAGGERLEALSALHLEELQRLRLELPAAAEGLAPLHQTHGLSSPARRVPAIEVSAISGAPTHAVGTCRVLVDRRWPRGLAREDPPFDVWTKDAAPSADLERWFGGRRDRFGEFERRYRRELSDPKREAAVHELRHRAQVDRVVLLTAAREPAVSGAAVLREVLAGREGARR